MEIKQRIRNYLDRATQDWDGRDGLLADALARIEFLESNNARLEDNIDDLYRQTAYGD